MGRSSRWLTLSRRQFVQAGALSGAALALAPLAATEATLITKRVPVGGQALPVIGIGTDSFSGAPMEALSASIARMAELGGVVIDTAAAYGDAEVSLGRILTELKLRERMFLATKLVGGGLAGVFGAAGASSFERSLQRLQTTHIDLLQIHNLNGVDELLPRMREWRQAGRIRYLGVTTSSESQHAQLAAIMRKETLDFIQVDYSIANRDAAAQILPLAQERGMGVLVNLPLGRAALLQQTTGRPLPPWAADIDVRSWGQFLLKYVVSHPAVTCAIPGATKANHVEDDQGAGRGLLPDATERQRMAQYWDSLR